MKSIARQQRRAALWGALEALRESWPARSLLGCGDLLRAHARARRGDLYDALDAASRIRRLLQINGLAERVATLERRIDAQTCVDPKDGSPRTAKANRLVDDFRRGSAGHSLFRGGLDSWERLVRLGGS